MANKLGSETSPYLLQHKDNPVDWHPWGDDALAEAAATGKPIMLSIGYAACHWCHVMAHESFEDPTIAALMNQLFINIKVDREERPDIDAVYMAALGVMGEQGGWPLTMFLTPEGKPFWGGTYFPPEARYGRPGFPDILRRIAEVYQTETAAIGENTEAILQSLSKLASGDADAQEVHISYAILDQVAKLLAEQVDMEHGGLGQAPKFPQTYAIEMILRGWLRKQDQNMIAAADITLTGMCQGGIYDHLAGGFARYSTDAAWLAPHFEKMLYDNAQLIDVLTLAWQIDNKPLYKTRIAETIAWTLDEMVVPGGGLAATLDADSEGEEGRFYVWQAVEIDAVLGDDATVFKAAYDVTPHGNWEGKTILNRSAKPELGDNAYEAKLKACREKLLQHRSKRIRPGWDDKVLADWNGLMIAALANAGAVFGQPAWSTAAISAYEFITDKLSPDGLLVHGYRQGQAKHRALLDDYANMSRAALVLFELYGDQAYLDQAKAWVAEVEAHFADPDRGGYFFSSDQATDVIARMRHCNDNAIPSGNGVMVEVLTKLWLLTGEAAYGRRAEALVTAFSKQLNHYALAMTTFLNSVEFMLRPLQIVIIGERNDQGVQDFLAVVHNLALPNKVLQVLAPGQTLHANHPAAAMTQIEDRATAYVCVGQTCSLPQTDPKALGIALSMASDTTNMAD
ncbi:MAG: thioredoxin domain-containing protein [Rhodospirillaceae bacterium]|nr:thioredoxin domain-containing protein [Rhodospirillaceae bacterium]MBT4044278.1 thioredoxin domain-containing protein [Rhodospirillaceae bacterium]MBT4687870.1 thioredoxin domain-containing protein [Rhodospirillaceae bacterium]MBT5079486.1 thioredoxin domain-containing protein [Rhodospirillaceae bacterium]MBT5523372.1 thioredoxin domain-containing protein [Rhodospirillaceae bacterium]